MAKKRSKRVYPPRVCINPKCTFGGKYTPHDKRQQYCNPQCRSDFNNDKRSDNNNSVFKKEKLLRSANKKLGKIYKVYVNKEGYCVVHREIFRYEGIDLRLLVDDQANVQTGGKTRWFYEFGTEMHPKDQNFFIIHKRETK